MTIKDLKRYPEMSEPQLRPRYSGVATFFGDLWWIQQTVLI